MLHQLAPPTHQPGGLDRRQGAGSDVGAILAQAVPRGSRHWAEPLPHQGEDRGGVSQDRGLGVPGLLQLLLGPLPHDPGERHAPPQRMVGGDERVPGGGKPLGQIPRHADLLRPLSGKEEQTHHRMTIAPQVKPAPKLTSATSAPGNRRPSSRAWASARRMDPAEVLP